MKERGANMGNPAFINVRLINDVWDGRSYKLRVGGRLAIRVDTITEVCELHEEDVYPPKEPVYRTTPTKMKIATIMKATGNGRGINGISYSYTIDEDSWNRVVKALGISF